MPKVPWHQAKDVLPDNGSKDFSDDVQRTHYVSSSGDQQPSGNYPAASNSSRRWSSASSANKSVASQGKPRQNGQMVAKLISRFAQDEESAATQNRHSVEQNASQASLNSTGGVSFLQKYSQSRPGSAASSQLIEQWAQNPSSKVDSSKRWDDAYSNENSHPGNASNENVDKAAFTTAHHVTHPQRSSTPIKEAGYEELPCVMNARKEHSTANGGCSTSRTKQPVNGHHNRSGLNSNKAFVFVTSRHEPGYTDIDNELIDHETSNDRTNLSTGRANGHGSTPVRSSNSGFTVGSSGNKQFRYYKKTEHDVPNESTFDNTNPFNGHKKTEHDVPNESTFDNTNPFNGHEGDAHENSGAQTTNTGSRPATFESALQSMLGTDTGNKPVTISHEQYDRFARRTKHPVTRKSRAASGRGRQKASQSPFASRLIRRESFGNAPRQSHASHLAWKPQIKVTIYAECARSHHARMHAHARTHTLTRNVCVTSNI